MIPTSDGKAAQAFFANLEPETAQVLRSAIQAAIAKSSELTAEVSGLGAIRAAKILDGLSDEQQAGIAKNAVKAVDDNIVPIEDTAMDAAVAVFAAHPHQLRKVKEAISGPAAAVVAGAAITGGLTAGKVRHDLYHAGSLIGDAEAIASGNPEKIVRRAGQHIFWRAFGKLGRGIFRGIGGKR